MPRLQHALQATVGTEILDLCSGGGGPIVELSRALTEAGVQVHITMTDMFPNHGALYYTKQRAGEAVDFIEEPVDATAVPEELAGFRTFFASFHHFRPEAARSILQDAVDKKRPIAVFEVTERRISAVLASFTNILLVLLVTPFIRPFKWSRLLLTYLLPVVPFYVLWDGMVSCLRTYTVGELQEMVNSLGPTGYIWEIGREPGFPTGITHLIGYPEAS